MTDLFCCMPHSVHSLWPGSKLVIYRMLGQCWRRWPSIVWALFPRVVFASTREPSYYERRRVRSDRRQGVLTVVSMQQHTALCTGTPLVSRKTTHAQPMLVQCWATVCDGGPTLNQHWFIDCWKTIVTCLHLYASVMSTNGVTKYPWCNSPIWLSLIWNWSWASMICLKNKPNWHFCL